MMNDFDLMCSTQRKRIRQLELNEQYQQSFDYNGRRFVYDPDYDCFYPVKAWEELSYWDRYGWLWTIAVLTVICWFVSQ